jgi:predicted transcriptional regulator YheO
MIDDALLRYTPIADLIARTFGSDCEVVIHDLSIPQNSVVYAVNGHVTGRRVGQSFDHLISRVLVSKNFSNDCTANYFFTAGDGRRIRSSTALIRDGCGKAIGALCVNIDTTRLNAAAGWLAELAALGAENGDPAGDSLPEFQDNGEVDSIHEVVDDLIDRILPRSRPKGMKREQKLELIRFMDEKGVFLIKGAVGKVAERLGVSSVTVYSYLDEIRKRTPQD